MELVVNGRVINEPIINILKELRSELSNGKLKDIVDKGDEVVVTCPCDEHKGGMESHPSCGVVAVDTKDVEYGTFHCFTCGESGPLYVLIAKAMNKDEEYAKEWLVEHFGNVFVERRLDLPMIDLYNDKRTKQVVGDSLSSLDSYCSYLSKRKLSRAICERFNVKYDKDNKCVVFPCYDEFGRLVMTTRRSVENKRFYIEKDIEKPIYLLNEIIKNNIQEVCVCESQINALTCWEYGVPAIATFGCNITSKQFEILNKSGIFVYNLLFDGDDAGDKGIARFIKNIRKDVIVNVVPMPRGKDVNDLEKEEFLDLLKNYTK